MKGLEEQLEDNENSEKFIKAIIFLLKNNKEYFEAVINKLKDIKTVLTLSLLNDIKIKYNTKIFKRIFKICIITAGLLLFFNCFFYYHDNISIINIVINLINLIILLFFYYKKLYVC